MDTLKKINNASSSFTTELETLRKNIMNEFKIIEKNISEIFNKFNTSIDKNKNNNSIDEYIKQPKILQQGTLRQHQLYGVSWLYHLYKIKINCILADEMGMGKTIQAIAFIALLKEKLNILKYHLIIVPKSTWGNWEEEFNKWLPCCNLITLLATKEDRYEIIAEYINKKKFDVILTTYEGAKICSKIINKISFESVIIDEGHKLKNNESQNFLNFAKIKSRFKLILTGTPLQNNIIELGNLLNFIMPKLFKNLNLFNNINDYLSIEKDDNKKLEAINANNNIVHHFILKRNKSELENKLPDKKIITLFCPLTNIQSNLYKKLLLNKGIKNQDRLFFKNILMQLRKCCNHPYLFEGIEEEGLPVYGDHLYKTCGKLMIVDKLLKKYEGKSQVLIFCSMTGLLDILEDYLKFRNYDSCRIDGNTSNEDRNEQIKEFTDPKSKKFIFLLSTRSGGLGINLFSANIVILYDIDFNPQVDLQAMDRSHRIGQTKEVFVYKLISKNTMEEKILERQLVKLNWDKLVINKNTNKNKIRESELFNIITFGAGELLKDNNTDNIDDIDIDKLIDTSKKLQNEKYGEDTIKNNQEFLKLDQKTINCYNYENEDYKQILKKIKEEERIIQEENKKINQKLEEDDIKKQETKKYYPIIINIKEFNFYENLEELKSIIDKEKNMPLEEKEIETKNKILSTGFDWKQKDFNKFCRSLEIYDSTELNKISKFVNKDVEEIKNYKIVFNKRYKELKNGESIIEKIEKFKQKRILNKNIEIYLKEFVGGCDNFLDLDISKILPVRYKYAPDSYFDKFLIFNIAKNGINNINIIKEEFANESFFSLNIFYQRIDIKHINSRIGHIKLSVEKKLNK